MRKGLISKAQEFNNEILNVPVKVFEMKSVFLVNNNNPSKRVFLFYIFGLGDDDGNDVIFLKKIVLCHIKYSAAQHHLMLLAIVNSKQIQLVINFLTHFLNHQKNSLGYF